jgi:hypothetical protein
MSKGLIAESQPQSYAGRLPIAAHVEDYTVGRRENAVTTTMVSSFQIALIMHCSEIGYQDARRCAEAPTHCWIYQFKST